MRFVSTRGESPPVRFEDAVRAGAAPDGGLYAPERLPEGVLASLTGDESLAGAAHKLLAPVASDGALAAELAAICTEAFSFEAPLVTPDPARPELLALELFHGPTGAFKDFGARVLMACLASLTPPDEPLTVLAATSGDTGGAVGCAAEGRKGVRAVILFPKGRVSEFQRHQLTCWDAPVSALEIEGDFDACQALVKSAFADKALSARHRLTSANSINLARLLPQGAYLARAAAQARAKTGITPGLIIPTGNLGHGVAALYARAMGAPIGPVVLATNANAALSEWAATGAYRPRASLPTMANAMDVGAPSNFERLDALPAALSGVDVERVEDDAIAARIISDFLASGYVWCPHSATGAEAFARLPAREQTARPWIVAATAHPFKFADIVEPLIGRAIDPPPALKSVLSRPSRAVQAKAELSALIRHLDSLKDPILT
ncbi:threonine synthase [Alkalicaulis satelles]|uniref:Threonine synthase n=1 Tax=Alkalicaulis satelles TaxID=2609175 RepID=A0A5M6ZAR9_9PROT|nr:threonine synthase [Alkalicaulis satelles]KAA5801004.1 threonine synthase [Alkalicaulis satelles]